MHIRSSLFSSAKRGILGACVLLFSGGVLLTVPVTSFAATGASHSWRSFVVSADQPTHTGRLISIDGKSGTVLRRVPLTYGQAIDSPSMLISQDGSRLYLATRIRSKTGRESEGVELLDTSNLRSMASALVPARIRYVGQEYTRMALSQNERRLFLYAYDWQHPDMDWLTILNAATLKRESTRIFLPGCGAEQMATTGKYVTVFCQASSMLYLINPRRMAIAGRVLLSSAMTPVSNIVASANGKGAYLADANLDLFVIKLGAHPTARIVSGSSLAGRAVASPSLVAVGGRWLVAATSVAEPGTAGVLHVYSLVSLKPVASFNVFSSYRSLGAAPNGFYNVPFSSASRPSSVERWQFRDGGLGEIDLHTHVSIRGSISAFASQASS